MGARPWHPRNFRTSRLAPADFEVLLCTKFTVYVKSRGLILRVMSSETRSVCVKHNLNTRHWLVNALVTWHVSYKITTLTWTASSDMRTLFFFLKRISVQHTGSRKHTSQAKKRQAHKQKHTSKPSNIRQVFVCGRRACAALAARVRQPHYTDLWAEPRQQQQQQALNVKSAAEARLQQCSSLAADNNMEDMLRLSRPELEVEQLNCLTEQPQTD